MAMMGEAKRRGRPSKIKEVEFMPESNAERPMRPDMREEDPRAAAEARAAQILEHIGAMDEGTDEFYFDPSLIPAGWTYEWKRHTTLGQEDPAYQVQLSRTGWQSVPVSRHPEMMPAGWTGPILRKGNMLMERPAAITDMVKERDKRRAGDQVRVKEAQIASSAVANMPSGFEATNKGNPLGKIRSTVEPMAIPK